MSAKLQPAKKSNAPKALSKWYSLAGILVLTILVFAGNLSDSFVSLDDTYYITANPHIKSLSPASIQNIFTTFYNANYHPLTTLLFAIEFNLFGENAVPYHFISLLIHLVNILLVFFLLEKFSAQRAIAIIGALLFAIHPMHVESVAWISEQKDLLYSLFYIAGLIKYIEHIRNPNNKNLAVVFFLFLLSLLSKSAAVTFPLLLLLFDYYFKRGWNGKVRLEKIPFFLLSLAFGIITLLSQKSAGAVNADLIPPYPVFERIFVVSYALVYYLGKFFLPINLCAMHYAPTVLPWYYYVSPLLIAGLVFFILKAKAMKQDIIFGMLFYVFSIILVVQIIPVGYAIVSERYSYIPYIGLFFIAGSFYARVMKGEIVFASIRNYLNYALAALVVFFCILSFQRVKVWNDSFSLFTDVVAKYPDEAAGHFSLGKIQNEAGDQKSALVSYARAIELNPTYPEVYHYRGDIYFYQKNYPAALNDYKKATELKPDFAEALNNVGSVYLITGDYENAVTYFSKAISIRPNEKIYRARADSYFYLKKYSEALDDYGKVLELNPQLSDAHYNRGACYLNLQKNEEACAEWKAAFNRGYTKADEMIQAYCK